MTTPIGNPQNLFLYGRSGLSLPAFLQLMLPYSGLSLLLLIAWIFFLCRKSGSAAQVRFEASSGTEPDNRKIALYAVLFALCLLTVIRVLPYPALFCIVLAAVLCTDRKTVFKVDYSLLLTFAAFFVFIGNIGRVEAFSAWLRVALTGREVPTAVLASQIISNVPAALLLSGFTDCTTQLIIGTNLGGLGTPIASMASLISFRQIAAEEPERKGAYFALFSVSNVVFLAILMGAWLLLS
jgi:Na+/H+ antiporter NhaD/arsenite permease-like protein